MTNDAFYNAYTSNFNTKKEVLNEMEKVLQQSDNSDESDLIITTEYVIQTDNGKRETFYWKDLDPNSRYLTDQKDRTSIIARLRIGNTITYGVVIAKRNKKKLESSFVVTFPQKKDAQIMQALCFRMAELQ